MLYLSNQGSQGGRELARRLGVRTIRHNNSRFRGGPDKKVINWGATDIPNPEVLRSNILNHPTQVLVAVHKLHALACMGENGVSVPDFTQDKNVALGWLDEGKEVLARTMLRASGGAGIVKMSEDRGVNAPLYVKYIPKRDEYRVHVFRNEPADIQRKARRLDVDDENVDWKIRNRDNGFIYARDDVDAPDKVVREALGAIGALGLDFGAVDVIWNSKREEAYVLEVNTAPGLEGHTLDFYTEMLTNLLGNDDDR